MNPEVTKRCRLFGLTNSALDERYIREKETERGGLGLLLCTAVRMEPK
jgi:hypothetical protein